MTIINVQAIDRDIGIHAKIIYSISNETDENNQIQPFGINPDTGDVYLLKRLDYEKQTRHVIGVKAKGKCIGTLKSLISRLFYELQSQTGPKSSASCNFFFLALSFKNTVLHDRSFS